ncbi:MAG: hypothetical protein V7K97_18205 [Nostoc sp.]
MDQQLAICGCFVLLISHLNGNSETCYAKLPEPLNIAPSLQIVHKLKTNRSDRRRQAMRSPAQIVGQQGELT